VKKKINLSFLAIVVIITTLFSSISFAATVGQQSTSPDAGWKRYDDSNPAFQFTGQWITSTYAGNYNSTVHYSTDGQFTTTSFKFKGTKLRIIASVGNNRPTVNSNEVVIDGNTVGAYSTYSTTTKYQILVYEITNLPDTAHDVVINSDGLVVFDAIDIDDTGYLIGINDLVATSNVSAITLTWTNVPGASYTIQRSTTSGGPYQDIGTSSTNTFTDTAVVNGTTYYYVVIATKANGEQILSNEASAMPITPPNPDRAILTIYISGGQIKEYDLSTTEVNAFISWYDAKDAGNGPAKYAFTKTWNKGPFKTRTEYVIFDKILTFDVDEYDAVNP